MGQVGRDMATDLMAGKRGLIMGLANDKSIAWGIARALHGAGAELAFSYQGDALKKRVDPLAALTGGSSARARSRISAMVSERLPGPGWPQR